MDTIRNYLENIFKTLPKTEEIIRLKNELLGDMEAKYQELRQTGSTENEAVGKVIGEFGNIDELLDEMGIDTVEEDGFPVITLDEAREFVSHSQKISYFVASGVAIIMISVSIFIGLTGFIENGFIDELIPDIGILPVVLLLLMIIPAIALFIYSGTLAEKYGFIAEGSFMIDFQTQSILRGEMETKRQGRTAAVIIGTCLCIFSAAILLVFIGIGGNFSILGVCLLLVVVGAAVFIFISSSGALAAYEKLLKTGEYAPKEKHANKAAEGAAGIVWPITVCIFLIWGFIFDGWAISWIVFPVTGLLFGSFSALYSGISKK